MMEWMVTKKKVGDGAPGAGQWESKLAFYGLVAGLATAKVNNRTLRMSLIPTLVTDNVTRTLAEQLPYAWMTTVVIARKLKAFSFSNDKCNEHNLARFIWSVRI